MKKLYIVIMIIITIFSSGCSQSFYEERVLSDEQWIEDIEYLDDKLRTYQDDLFKNISEEEWNKNLDDLKSEVSNLSDTDIKLRIAQIIASIQDGHIGMLPSEMLLPVPSQISMREDPQDLENILQFPIKVEYFDDGLRVLECDEKYKEILGTKLISINGIDINLILNDISTLFKQDYKNNQFPLEMAKDYLNIYDFLKFFNVVDNKSAKYEFENDDKEVINLILKAVDNQDITYISTDKKEMKTNIVPKGKSEYYWVENFKEDNILYFQFNTFSNSPEKDSDLDFYKVVDEFFEEIDNKNFSKLVIDLRKNGGGYSSLGDAITINIQSQTDLKGKDMYVIIGKRTFSAAPIFAWNLKSKLGATVIGEQSGSNVSCSSVGGQQELPNSKLKPLLSVGGKIVNETKYIGPVNPDIEIKQTYEDYINGVDTIYDYIKNINDI
ncbi:MAG: S41 family peptidase [Paraclostridium sp.]